MLSNKTHIRGVAGQSRRSLALVVAVALSSTACSGMLAPTQQPGGPSVEYGAPIEQYRAALTDMEPVTIHLQSSAGKGAQTGRRFEEYAAAVEDWSAGKISFNTTYASSIASGGSVDNALSDGRLDMASVQQLSEPAVYPAMSNLIDLSFLGSQKPVSGLLQYHGALNQQAQSSGAVTEELVDKNIHVLMPVFGSGSSALMCQERIANEAEFEGHIVSVLAQPVDPQVRALGLSPVSLPYGEVYESLQRKVVDCANTSLTVASLGGFVAFAPHFMIDDDVGFATAPGTFAINNDTWINLPLAAQQLLYDKLTVFLEGNLRGTLNNVAGAVEVINANGGEVAKLPAGAAETLAASNAESLARIREERPVEDPELAQDLEDAFAEWAALIPELVDLQHDSYTDFDKHYSDDSLDLTPYIDAMFEKTMLDWRPR